MAYDIDVSKYRALLLDVDGTLYFQKMLRTKMALALGKYYILHPNRIKDLKIISVFRNLREEGAFGEGDLAEIQYSRVASKFSIDTSYVKNLVEKWMYHFPLQYLPACRDDALAEFIKTCRDNGMKIVVYSDYPAADKLKALGIEADFCFSSTDPEISCLKPDPRAMRVILDKTGLAPSECLYIGDRYEKDGLAAQSAAMDYIILPAKKARRNGTLPIATGKLPAFGG